MIRTYETPQAFKMAIEARLREQARSTGTDMGRLRQLIVFDRYLARLFTVFGPAIVLKGGLVLEFRLERARTTKDIDLRLMGDPDEVLGKLQEAGRLNLNDYLQYEVGVDPENPDLLADGLPYQGRRYRAEARLAGKIYGSPFGIDIAFAEPVVGEPDTVTGSAFLDFIGVEPVTYRVYPVETHIAEKLHAFTMPRRSPNSRVKDLPDIALLATSRPLDAIKVRVAIERTFQHRATHEIPQTLPDPAAGWKPVYERIARADDLPWKTIEDLVDAVRRFYTLRDTVFCAMCGSPLHGNAGYYRCSEANHDCRNGNIKQKSLETAIFQIIVDELFTEAFVEKAVKKLKSKIAKGQDRHQAEHERLLKKKDKIATKRDRLFALYEDERIDADMLSARMDKLMEGEAQIKEALCACAPEQPFITDMVIDSNTIRRIKENFLKEAAESSPLRLKRLIGVLFKKIEVGPKIGNQNVWKRKVRLSAYLDSLTGEMLASPTGFEPVSPA